MAEQRSFEQQLAAALAAVGGGVIGKSMGGSGGGNVPPQLGQMLDMSLQQQAYQNPLRQAVTQGAYGMLPTFMRQGTQLTGGLSNSVPAAGNWGGGDSGGISKGGIAGGAGLAALAALLGKGGASSGGDLSALIKKIRGLFGKKPGGSSPDWAGPIDQPGWGDDDFGRDASQWDPQPSGSVNTDEWMGQWPETTTPFDPFDPGQLPQSGAGGDGPFDSSGWEDGW